MYWIVLDREFPTYGALVVEASDRGEALRNGFREWYGEESGDDPEYDKEVFEALVAFQVPENVLDDE